MPACAAACCRAAGTITAPLNCTHPAPARHGPQARLQARPFLGLSKAAAAAGAHGARPPARPPHQDAVHRPSWAAADPTELQIDAQQQQQALNRASDQRPAGPKQTAWGGDVWPTSTLLPPPSFRGEKRARCPHTEPVGQAPANDRLILHVGSDLVDADDCTDDAPELAACSGVVAAHNSNTQRRRRRAGRAGTVSNAAKGVIVRTCVHAPWVGLIGLAGAGDCIGCSGGGGGAACRAGHGEWPPAPLPACLPGLA